MVKKQPGLTFPSLSAEVKDNLSLVFYHDGLDVTTSYLDNFLPKFQQYFSKIYILLEDEIDVSSLLDYKQLMVVKTIKPVNLGTEWTLILEPGEFPSIQLLNNLENILADFSSNTKVILFPLVICDFKTGDIIDIRPPVARLFRQNPQVLQNNDSDFEKVLEDYPLIRLYVDFEELSAESETKK